MVDPIPTDATYDLTKITDLTVSPDGDAVAFVADEFDPSDEERRRSLFVVPTDGSRPPHRLTRVGTGGSPKWSPDARRLGFLATRERDVSLAVGRRADGDDGSGTLDGEEDEPLAGNNGDDADTPGRQLWVFDLDRGGDARQVTDRDEGVSEFDWAPDGERAVVASRDPTDEEREYLERRRDDGPIESERLLHKFDGHGYLDAVTTYLFVVDIATRETTRLDGAYEAGAAAPMVGTSPAWSPDGDRIAFVSNRGDRPDDSFVLDVCSVAADGGDVQRHTDGSLMARSLEYGPEGDRIAFVGREPTNWYVPPEMYVVDADAGDGERTPRSLSASLDRAIPWLAEPNWSDAATVVLPVSDRGLTRLARLPVDGDPELVFEGQGRDRSMTGFDLGGGVAVCRLSSPADGEDLFAAPVDALVADDPDPLVRLTAVNDDLLSTYDPPRCRRFSFESDGLDVEGFLHHPPEFDPANPDPRPAILSIHGGPQWYDAPRFDFVHAYWTSRGYVVLTVNYRGSTSYGRSFCEALRGNWDDLEVADLAAGVEAAVDRGWADPARVFVTGFSYGGTATARLVAHTDLFAAAAPEHGVYDRRSSFGTDDAHVWWTHEYGLPWEDPEVYDEGSTILDVEDVSTPTLVTAGGEDWRCPPGQAEQLHVSLQKVGVESKLVVYPDEHHDVGDPDRAIHRLEAITGWFERHDPGADD